MFSSSLASWLTLPASYWNWLTRPHPDLADIGRRRQSRLLAGLMLIVVISSFIGSLLLLNSAGSFSNTLFYLWAAQLITLAIYMLNRHGRYQLSARLFVGLNFLLVHGVPLINGDLAWLLFTPMLIILSAILMPSRITRYIFTASLLIQILYHAYLPGVINTSNTGIIIVFSVTSPLILLLVAHRNLLERERQAELQQANQKLRESELLLEQRVVERTEQLSAAKEVAERARERAEKADKVKSQFLASMSHELRTPLNAILNFTEMIHLDMVGPVNEKQKELLGKSLQSSRHLLSLINDILDVAKIQSGVLSLFIEDEVNLHEEIAKVIVTVEPLLQYKPLCLTQEISPNLPYISGDRRRIRQILLNLLANAVKFTEEGTITLQVAQQDTAVLFAVKDTGPGIPPEQQATIFEPFVQTSRGAKLPSSTGLGLAISRQLALAHGGRLWVESQPGVGSTFYVSLPFNPPRYSAVPTNV